MLKLSENPRRRAVWERRKQKEKDDELIKMSKNGQFVDPGIRLSCSVPSDYLKNKFQFMNRKNISPNMKPKKVVKEWNKEERIKFGIDSKDIVTSVRPMLKDYLKFPMSHTSHPVQQQISSRNSAIYLKSQASSPLNRRSSMGSCLDIIQSQSPQFRNAKTVLRQRNKNYQKNFQENELRITIDSQEIQDCSMELSKEDF